MYRGVRRVAFVKLKDGTRLWYEEKGEGSPIVFVHGWLGSSWHFRNQMDYFSKAFRVFVLDHKGHGKSDRPEDAAYTISDFAKELDQALDQLIGNEKVVLAGQVRAGQVRIRRNHTYC